MRTDDLRSHGSTASDISTITQRANRLERRASRSTTIVVSALLFCLTTGLADGVVEDGRRRYEYTVAEVNTAAENDLNLALGPFKVAGKLNRETPELARVRSIFARMVNAAMQRSDIARSLDWAIFVPEGRFVEAYSRAGGKVVISSKFLERYQPNNEELAFVIGHELAHVICEHERMNLSAVWRINAPQQLQARYAMEFLDTEPLVRAQLAPVARLQERIADTVGLALVVGAGIDPLKALGFFDKSARDEYGGMFPDLHDSPVQRKASLKKNATLPSTIWGMLQPRGASCGL